jgi:hypothetical protein
MFSKGLLFKNHTCHFDEGRGEILYSLKSGLCLSYKISLYRSK